LVDSGRLAEPFWYVDSPLTTPNPAHPFTGRPPRGAVPPACPGVIVPDLPVFGCTALRRLCRDGLLVLAAPGASLVAAQAAAAELKPVPARAAAMAALNPEMPGLLGARDGEWWVVRPDAYLTAVVEHAADLVPALSRAIGQSRAGSGGAIIAAG
jgi:hypothetical protein